MKNYSSTICNLEKRQFSAKGYKFLHQCQQIALNKNGIIFYSVEVKTIKEKIRELIEWLVFDKLLTISEIKLIIKNRIEKNTLKDGL